MRGQAAPTIAAVSTFVLVFWLIGLLGPAAYAGSTNWDGAQGVLTPVIQFLMPAPDVPIEDTMYKQFAWGLFAAVLAFFLTR